MGVLGCMFFSQDVSQDIERYFYLQSCMILKKDIEIQPGSQRHWDIDIGTEIQPGFEPGSSEDPQRTQVRILAGSQCLFSPCQDRSQDVYKVQWSTRSKCFLLSFLSGWWAHHDCEWNLTFSGKDQTQPYCHLGLDPGPWYVSLASFQNHGTSA